MVFQLLHSLVLKVIRDYRTADIKLIFLIGKGSCVDHRGYDTRKHKKADENNKNERHKIFGK